MERGFSVNNSVISTNMIEKSIVSKRLVKNYINANNMEPEKVEITREIRSVVKLSYSQYRA